MRYVIETSYPKQSVWSRAKRVFTPGWWGGAPYLAMGQPYTDGINTQHVDLRIKNAIDEEANGHTIAHAHVPNGHTLVAHTDVERAISYIEGGNEEKALALLKCMAKRKGTRYQSA